MKNLSIHRGLPAVLLAGLAWAGCATTKDARGTRLSPAPASVEAGSIPGNRAVDSSPEVRVTIHTGEWPGDARVLSIVHPVRIRMENRGERPVLVTYDKFVLLGPLGRRFEALPPYALQGTLERPVVREGYDPIPEPIIIYERFEVSPSLHPVYPAMPAFAGVLMVDTIRHNHLHRSLAGSGLPTKTLLERALPEGALKGGGILEGFLYFEKVPADIRGVSLLAQFVDVRTGEPMGNAIIPMVVDAGAEGRGTTISRGQDAD